MKKPKMTETERKIKSLERLLKRREREISETNKHWQQEVMKLQHRNRLTQFQIDSIKKGEWPL